MNQIGRWRPWNIDDDWRAWLNYKHLNLSHQESGNKLGRTKAATQARISYKGLAYHPPTGEPPRDVKAKMEELGVTL